MTTTATPAPVFERAVPTHCRVVYSSRTVRVYLPRDRAGTTMGWLRIDGKLPAALLDDGIASTRIVTLRPHRKGESVVTIPVRPGEGQRVAEAVAKAVRPTVASVSAAAPRPAPRPAPRGVDAPALSAWLRERGAMPDPTWGYALAIQTKLGLLSVTPYEGWIACRFHDVTRAAAHFGVTSITQQRLNPVSGKWNWHPHANTYGSLDAMVATFKGHVESLLPEVTP